MDHIRRLFEHLFWADERLLTSIESSPAPAPHAALRLFSHVLAAERIWLIRLNEQDSSIQPIWPELAIDDLRPLVAANRAGYTSLLNDEAAPVRLKAPIRYTNQSGRSFQSTGTDILLQVALHGSYHRGQVAQAIRSAGGEPTNTDFITFVREGY
jgi:uncharacterized damage-inducible protein DinB